jgi:hypothetical protein
MLRTPTDLERESLVHVYDPVKAHEYYLRVRELEGRKKGSDKSSGGRVAGATTHVSSRAKQKADLQETIQRMTAKLHDLQKLIRTKQHDEAAANRKSLAKKERAAKEKDKPQTAAEKAKAARENKKYRDQNQQKLKAKAKAKDDASSSGGGDSQKSSTGTKSASVSELKSLATKVKGQIAVAKQKLAAL